MNIAIRYYSRTGNTKVIAELIAESTGCMAKSIDVPLEEETDLLFLGGAIYWGKIPKVLKLYIKELSPQKVKRVAVFTTSGIIDVTCGIYKEYLRNHDLKVMKETYFCNGKEVFEVKNREYTAEFTKKVMERVESCTIL